MTSHVGETREEQAQREVGHTAVGHGTAMTLVAAFTLLVVAMPLIETVFDGIAAPSSPWTNLTTVPRQIGATLAADGPLAANRELLARIHAFEDTLDERSFVTRHTLKTVRWLLVHSLSAGTDQVIIGREGWLYFRPAVDYLTGPGFLATDRLSRRARGGSSWEPPPHPDPIPAIADFSGQLATRGIGLVVLVTPVKAAVHPEGLATSLGSAISLSNPSFAEFARRLAELGVPLYTPEERLRQERAHGRQEFLRTDTHWTPHAVQTTARGLAHLINSTFPLPERHPVPFRRRTTQIRGRGDLASLLGLPDGDHLVSPETVDAHFVLSPDGQPWEADPAADILLLGDSFSNIYSQPELGWGQGAGLAEQLSAVLRRPVSKIAVNAGGPAAARERLASLIAAGQDPLATKRLVIYQFAARELTTGDWRLVSLGEAPNSVPAARGHHESSRASEPPLMKGDLYWESRRSGAWRIWTRRLEGSPPRQLSPDEPGRQHCCAHVSPDGQRVIYLSREAPTDEYPDPRTPGELWLIKRNGREPRHLADGRVYGWGDRAAVWINDSEVVSIGTDGRTYRLNVDTLKRSPLTDPARGKSAWLLDATLQHAVQGAPIFSRYDAASERIIEGTRRSGCEPYFTHDGRFGFWVARGGGPINWIELATGHTGPLLTRDDERIPGRQRYVYFPMVSRDGRMLAFGASPGDHDHFRSNYDVFVAPVLPTSLEMLGRPVRLTQHPGSDRYPDLHLESLALARWKREMPPVPVAAPETRAAPPASGDPFSVQATLTACSRTPSLREISPYRSALVVCEWHVDETLAGRTPGPRVRVAHWALREGHRQRIASLPPGITETLRVEPLAGFAQAESYPIFDTLPRAPLATYYARIP